MFIELTWNGRYKFYLNIVRIERIIPAEVVGSEIRMASGEWLICDELPKIVMEMIQLSKDKILVTKDHITHERNLKSNS